jgi:hypothetical protein
MHPGDPLLVQGGSLRTWSFRSPFVERVEVVLSTEGRPMDAEVELWQGPGNTPLKLRTYSENGRSRPFRTVLETPRRPSTVAVRNAGQMELPLVVGIRTNPVQQPSRACIDSLATVQGGAVRAYAFDPDVSRVQILLETDGRPLNARIELLQGPSTNKQVVELYTEDGSDRPFFCFLDTPGRGNVVRIVNTAPVEYPMAAAATSAHVQRDAAERRW